MDVLALIPARGGSKSIPRKNILEIAGKPLISYSIGHALGSSRVTRTVVSTDDDEIAKVSKKYGAEVPFMRPSQFATDSATDLDVFRHALLWLRDKEGYCPEVVLHLRPTGPIRSIDLIDKAIDLFVSKPGYDALRSVSLSELTPYKMWHIKNGELDPLSDILGIPGGYAMPRQALPKVYWQNGHIDLTRPNTVLNLNSMTGNKVLPFVIEEPIYELDYPEQINELEQALLGKGKKRVPGEHPR